MTSPMGNPGYQTKARNGLIAAIAGLLCCGPLCILGIVWGNQAKAEAQQYGAPAPGMAQAAFIVGIIGAALWVLGVVLNFTVLASST